MNAATTALHPISTAQELMIYREGMYPTSVTENREPVRHPRPRRGRHETARRRPFSQLRRRRPRRHLTGRRPR